MSRSSIYVEVLPEEPDGVYLVRRDERANGHREEFVRIPNDLIKTAIEELLRVLPEPEGPQSLQEQDMADQFSSAAETENGFGIGPLCEEDPAIPARCAYHACYH